MATLGLEAKAAAIAQKLLPTEIQTIVTHAGCPDGIASAMLLWNLVAPGANVEFVQYGTPDHENLKARPGMLFCDMTPPRGRNQEFVDAGAYVLDHHKGAADLVAAYGERGLFADENNQLHRGVSGAMLAYMVAFALGRGNVSRGTFARLVGIRDTWRKTDPEWTKANAVSSALIFYGWENLKHQTHLDAIQTLTGEIMFGKRLAKARRIADRNLVRMGNWLLFNDGERMISDVAEAARSNGSDCYGVAGFEFSVESNEVRLRVSLRSLQDEIDVSKLARLYGGGGHTAAAGFTINNPPTDPFTYIAELLN